MTDDVDLETSGMLDGLTGEVRSERAELIPWLLEQGITAEGIVVEDDAWIGAGAIITDGVTVGRGAVAAVRRLRRWRAGGQDRGRRAEGRGHRLLRDRDHAGRAVQAAP